MKILAISLTVGIGALVAPFDVAQGSPEWSRGAPLGQPGPSRDSPADGVANPLWHVEGEGWGTPAADESTVYFLTKAHAVVALDADSGTERWRARTGEPGPTTAGSIVLVSGDEVIAGDYNLVAFDRSSGALRWRFTPDDGYAPGIYLGAIPQSSRLSGELVFAGSPGGRLFAIDQRSGNARWSHLVADDGRTTVFAPVADEEIVAAGYTTFTAPLSGGIVVLEARTGRERWRVAFPRPADPLLDSNWAGGPVLARDAVIAASGEGVVYAFDRRSGAVRWTLPKWSGDAAAPHEANPAAPRERDFRPLARWDDLVFVGSLSGAVIAYDLGDRGERWRYSSDRNGSVAFRMTSDARTVYVPYVDGRLVALDITSGRERWRTSDSLAGFAWPPAVTADRVFAADSLSGFFAFAR